MATKDSSLCAFPDCGEAQNTEAGLFMCDVHSGLLGFIHWYFNHATYNGIRVCDILGTIATQMEEPQGPSFFGPDGLPLPPRPSMWGKN